MKDPLESTRQILRLAYPSGVPEDEYLPLLFFLSEYLSEGNLERVIEDSFPDTGRKSVLNDVLKAKFDEPNFDSVVSKLRLHGLKDWLDEGD